MDERALRRGQMLLVHGDRAEPALPEMTGASASGLDRAAPASAAGRRDRTAPG